MFPHVYWTPLFCLANTNCQAWGWGGGGGAAVISQGAPESPSGGTLLHFSRPLQAYLQLLSAAMPQVCPIAFAVSTYCSNTPCPLVFCIPSNHQLDSDDENVIDINAHTYTQT